MTNINRILTQHHVDSPHNLQIRHICTHIHSLFAPSSATPPLLTMTEPNPTAPPSPPLVTPTQPAAAGERQPSPTTAAAAGLTVPNLSTWDNSTRALTRQHGWIELPWDEAAQSLARQNRWGPIPTATNNIWNNNLAAAARHNGFHNATDGWGELPTLANGVWNDNLTQVANAQGLYPRANNVPNLAQIPFTNHMATAEPPHRSVPIS